MEVAILSPQPEAKRPRFWRPSPHKSRDHQNRRRRTPEQKERRRSEDKKQEQEQHQKVNKRRRRRHYQYRRHRQSFVQNQQQQRLQVHHEVLRLQQQQQQQDELQQQQLQAEAVQQEQQQEALQEFPLQLGRGIPSPAPSTASSSSSAVSVSVSVSSSSLDKGASFFDTVNKDFLLSVLKSVGANDTDSLNVVDNKDTAIDDTDDKVASGADEGLCGLSDHSARMVEYLNGPRHPGRLVAPYSRFSPPPPVSLKDRVFAPAMLVGRGRAMEAVGGLYNKDEEEGEKEEDVNMEEEKPSTKWYQNPMDQMKSAGASGEE